MRKFLMAALMAAASSVHALSPDEVKQYLSGEGMGYAEPAELNHFPGPMHVLELADQLNLTAEQRAATKRLMDARSLEALFSEAVQAAAALEGEYRLSHLETHRRMRALLTEEQVKRYDALRGYSSDKPGHQHRH